MYNHKEIESKWQNYWEKNNTFKCENDFSKPKYYCLDMFPYPSGAGLHVGHPEGMTANDIVARYKKARGFNVLHPMGWDAFGLPAENYAIKTGTHPRITTDNNIETFRRQIKALGFSYDWDREIDTTDPKYYKWTQWIFLKLFEKGLAYEQDLPINYCPSCKTGLANEEVLKDFTCERCGTKVEKKKIRQWVLAITKYADRLASDVDKLDWPEGIKDMQRNWIGRSEGALFKQQIKGTDIEFETYNSVPQMAYADTFYVIAPDHSLMDQILTGVEGEESIRNELLKMLDKRNIDKYEAENEIEGIFTGRYISDPLGNGDLPLWIASYAIADYGTGIVKCSAHDERDFKFAKKYDIQLKVVLLPKDTELRKQVENLEVFYRENDGELIEPKEMLGETFLSGREKMLDYLEEKGFAKRSTSYKIRDWLFSRQRYWGEPIPLVHCDDCGIVGEKEENLPILLPETDNFEPSGDGTSPLSKIESFVNCECPKCGRPAKRETNTMPQWGGSCWYYLRYMDNNNSESLVDSDVAKYWGEVDSYVGGAEHAVLHLLYARFWHKFLFDIGVVPTDEPFYRLRNQGLILAHAFQRKNGGLLANDLVEEKDGKYYEIQTGVEVDRIVSKMSKSLKNVINPDDIIAEYGADSLRLYEMYMAEFKDAAPWDTKGIIGVKRFLDKSERLFGHDPKISTEDDIFTEKLLHKTIKKVESDIENYKFNTAIAALIILINNGLPKAEDKQSEWKSIFVILLQPFAPHLAEELNERLGNNSSLFNDTWPKYDEKMTIDDTIKIGVQVLGKLRGDIEVSKDEDKDSVLEKARNNEGVARWLEGKTIVKEIYVPGRIVNIVVK